LSSRDCNDGFQGTTAIRSVRLTGTLSAKPADHAVAITAIPQWSPERIGQALLIKVVRCLLPFYEQEVVKALCELTHESSARSFGRFSWEAP
jgi:hypothetical protein